MKGITIFYIFQNLRNNNLIDKDINFLLFIYIYIFFLLHLSLYRDRNRVDEIDNVVSSVSELIISWEGTKMGL